MDILDTIRDDHDRMREMLESILQADEFEMPGLRRPFNQLKLLFEAHSKAEEAVLYPLLIEFQEAREHILEAYEEHHVVDVLMGELSREQPDDRERWLAKLSVAGTLLQYHIDEEEGASFEIAQEVMSEEQLQQLTETFLQQKEIVKLSLRSDIAA